MNESRKDDLLTFEHLGVDMFFIDKAYTYKNRFTFKKAQYNRDRQIQQPTGNCYVARVSILAGDEQQNKNLIDSKKMTTVL